MKSRQIYRHIGLLTSGTNLYCNKWLVVLTSRDGNHPISWHPWGDVILKLKYWSVKIYQQDSFLSGIESVNWNQFTPWKSCIDELFDLYLQSTSSLVVEYKLCLILFDRSLLVNITLNCCCLISSSTLGEVLEGLRLWFFSSICL